MAILQEKNGVEGFEMKLAQGAKKIIFYSLPFGQAEASPKTFFDLQN